MEFIYKNNNKKLFLLKWNEYIKNNLVSYKYLLLNLEYFLLYSNHLLSDESFIVVENNECVGIAFVPIEKNNDIITISLANGYVFVPLAKNKRIEKKIFEELNAISNKYKIQKILFALDPLIIEYQEKFNILLEYGFVDTSTSDCLIRLDYSKEKLWANLRKSYKSLINNIFKSDKFEILIYNYNNADYAIHENYRVLHEQCSGGVTRVKGTFDKQFEMLENNYATLIGLKYNDKFIGFNYFFHYDRTVIYASGADDPQYEKSKIPIYHAILWSAIVYFKEKKFEFIEFSQPCGYNKLNGFNDYLDEKQINISHFKRGMGTRMITAFRGVKYLDREFFLKDINKFRSIL